MNNSIEDKLKKYILNNYKSLREFSIKCNIPYSTINSIFQRGIMNSNINNVIKICAFLNLSVDSISNGSLVGIEEKFDHSILSEQEQILLNNFNKLNDEGKERLLNYSDDLVSSKKYIQSDTLGLDKKVG